MSLTDRFRRWLQGEAPAPAAEVAAGAEPVSAEAPLPPAAVAASPSAAEPDPATRLAACTDDAAAVELFDEVARAAGEAVALAQARRALAEAPLPGLRARVGRSLDARGDDAALEAVLSRMPEGPEVPEALVLEAWSRRAEAAERRNDVDAARVLWERILARDVTYPRARERVAALRGDAPRRDAGATVMAEGALTRGRYRVVGELGRGGAGTVFLADDVSLERRVALKVYHRRGRADRERLLHEARMPAELEHPGVVTVLDVDLELFAIAMEITDGSVKDAARLGAVGTDRILAWSRSIVETLTWLHARGVVHRDLKPSNMLVRRERVVLTDFGLAARLGAGASGSAVAAGGEGTAGYMPPEQRRGEPPAPSMDVHALGVSIDEMLAWPQGGQRPAELARLLAAMRAPEAAGRPPLDEVRATLEAVG